MTPSDFAKYALESARMYWRYLTDNNKGFSEIKINSIKEISRGGVPSFVLSLGRSVSSADSVSFMINGEVYSNETVRPVFFNEAEKTLTISPKPQLYSVLRSPDSSDSIVILSDMRFLVERIGKWYKSENNYMNLSLPKQKPSVTAPKPEEYIDTPSKEQLSAINTIIESPISYIWGAPGTGKTKFVLSYVLMAYLSQMPQGKKIIISAPTNNAIDQILLGALPVLEKNGIDTDCILRLGIPGAELQRKYPRICEVKDNSQKLNDLLEIINGINAELDERQKEHNFKELESSVISAAEAAQHEYNNYIDLVEKRKAAADKVTGLKNKSSELKKEYDFARKALNTQDKKLSSLHWRLVFMLSKSAKERMYDKRVKLLEDTNKACALCSENSNEIKNTSEKLLVLDEELDYIKNHGNAVNKFKEIVPEYIASPRTVSDLSDIVSVCKERLRFFEPPARPENEFSDYSDDELISRLAVLNEEVALQDTIANRFSDSKIIALTADGVISRYSLLFEASDSIEHFFMDEAAYCPLIKAMPAYTFGCPITFLGDHKQLPPVCEMSLDRLTDNEKKLAVLWMQSAVYSANVFEASIYDIYYDFISCNETISENVSVSELSHTFRFGVKTADILANNVYSSRFTGNPDADTHIFVVNAPNGKREKLNSNKAEADAILKYLQDNPTSDYAILAPYKDQIRLLGTVIPFAKAEQRIMTVHASQGKEWDTVFLSVTDSARMWFMDSKNNISRGINVINTAVSRAKKNLIIVCDADFWRTKKNQLIGQFVNTGEIKE